MNEEFKRMKAGSEKINQMMNDIRWCISTILGMANGVRHRNFIPAFFMGEVVRKEIGTNPRDFDKYFIEVRMDTARDDISITFIAEESPGREIKRKLSDQWDPDEIKLVHDNLDTTINAVREFCQKIVPKIGGIAFDNSMTSLTYILDH